MILDMSSFCDNTDEFKALIMKLINLASGNLTLKETKILVELYGNVPDVNSKVV